jgi:hypothetical protein
MLSFAQFQRQRQLPRRERQLPFIVSSANWKIKTTYSPKSRFLAHIVA